MHFVFLFVGVLVFFTLTWPVFFMAVNKHFNEYVHLDYIDAVVSLVLAFLGSSLLAFFGMLASWTL